MKQLLSIFKTIGAALLFLTVFSLELGVTRAQIPNADFEVWNNGEPDGWFTNNAAPLVVAITQTNPGESGASALKGDVVQVLAAAVVAPLVITGHKEGSNTIAGFPVSTRPAALNGFYKFTGVSGDQFSVAVGFKKNSVAMGGGIFRASATQPGFVAFSAPIVYQTQETPDTAVITFTIATDGSATNVHFGSGFVVDNLSFGSGSAAVHSSASTPGFGLEQNYPNPFGSGIGSLKPSTMIRFALPKDGFTTLKVYDIRGVEVADLLGGVELGGTHEVFFDASNMAPGMYSYRLHSGNLTETKWMQIIK
jgi:hypothetical protein